MIIYGQKARTLARELVSDKCTHCQSQNSVELFIIQKYAHVFWIPMFPLGKTAVSQCQHCKQVLKYKEMSATLQDHANRLKAQVKAPFWTWAGLVVLALLIIGIIISTQNDTANTEKYIAAPASGDMYQIKTTDNQYTLARVQAVKGDSVYLQFNMYTADRKTGLSKLKSKEFSDIPEAFTQPQLQQMLREGVILQAER